MRQALQGGGAASISGAASSRPFPPECSSMRRGFARLRARVGPRRIESGSSFVYIGFCLTMGSACRYSAVPGTLSIIDSSREGAAMFNVSRRDFLRAAVVSPAIAAAPRLAAQAPARGRRLKVQFTPGGHTSPLQMYAMFTDAMFHDV